ncbi:MAG: hypothetical protein WB777_05690, partial [Mycobacterium sp.]
MCPRPRGPQWCTPARRIVRPGHADDAHGGGGKPPGNQRRLLDQRTAQRGGLRQDHLSAGPDGVDDG